MTDLTGHTERLPPPPTATVSRTAPDIAAVLAAATRHSRLDHTSAARAARAITATPPGSTVTVLGVHVTVTE